MFPSDRSHVDPFRVMQILVEAQSRIDASALGYTATLGIPEFREAIAQWHAQTYGNALTALGAKIIDLPCGAETRFQPTVEMLEACVEKPKALIGVSATPAC
ncbi:aspartate aminotransferase [Corynebacterium diphtheriae]|nr:aspartate aminotransferase [Corynebacterium diphtheriae]